MKEVWDEVFGGLKDLYYENQLAFLLFGYGVLFLLCFLVGQVGQVGL